MKVLFHCINGLGLGHLSRQVSIAAALRKLSSDIQVAFVTSAEEHTWLRDESIPYYFIPSEPHFRVTWKAKEHELSEKIRRISAPNGLNEVLFDRISEFWKPDRIVFDTYFSERMILHAKERGTTPIAFFDSVGRIDYNRERMEMVLGSGGKLIFGCCSVDENFFIENQSVLFAGRVLRSFGAFESPALADERNDSVPLIMCLQGGGGFAKENCRFYHDNPTFAEVTVTALCSLRSSGFDFCARFVLGPYGEWPNHIDIPNWMEVISFDSSLLKTLAEADLMISTAGYNTVCDSILSGCPAIFLPIVHLSEDQNAHVKDLVSAGLAFSVPHESSKLSEVLDDIFSDKRKIESMRCQLRELKKTNGAEKAARFILE